MSYAIKREDTGEKKQFNDYDEFHSIKSLLSQEGVEFETEGDHP